MTIQPQAGSSDGEWRPLTDSPVAARVQHNTKHHPKAVEAQGYFNKWGPATTGPVVRTKDIIEVVSTVFTTKGETVYFGRFAVTRADRLDVRIQRLGDWEEVVMEPNDEEKPKQGPQEIYVQAEAIAVPIPGGKFKLVEKTENDDGDHLDITGALPAGTSKEDAEAMAFGEIPVPVGVYKGELPKVA